MKNPSKGQLDGESYVEATAVILHYLLHRLRRASAEVRVAAVHYSPAITITSSRSKSSDESRKRTDADTHVWVEIIESSAAYNPHYFLCLTEALAVATGVTVADEERASGRTGFVRCELNLDRAALSESQARRAIMVETMNSTVAVTAPTRIAAVFWLVMVTVIGALLVRRLRAKARCVGLDTTPRPAPPDRRARDWLDRYSRR